MCVCRNDTSKVLGANLGIYENIFNVFYRGIVGRLKKELPLVCYFVVTGVKPDMRINDASHINVDPTLPSRTWISQSLLRL